MGHEIIDELSRADIAFRVRGRDLEDLFRAGAQALISIMLHDPGDIRPSISIAFECRAPDPELLYFDFLQEFIFYKDSERLLLLPERIDIAGSAEGYRLACAAKGEKIDQGRHLFIVDIKAITMHHLSVVKEKGTWSATVVVDV